MALFVVCGIYTKSIPIGVNIQASMKIIEAISSEEAVGKYLILKNKTLPDYELFQIPLFMSIENYRDSKTSADGIAQGRREAAEAYCKGCSCMGPCDRQKTCMQYNAILGTMSDEAPKVKE
jgi:hypothetical protein